MEISGANAKTKLILGAVLVILIAGGLWYWYSRPEPVKTVEDAVGAVTSTSLEIPSNPVQNRVPELNPIDRANPFKDAYKNPFE